MALQTSTEDPEKNPSQTNYEGEFKDINNAEKTGNFDNTSKNAVNTDDINNNETNYANYVSGIVSKTEKITNHFSFIKKKGPLATIIIVILLGGIGVGGLISPALLTQTITGNALKFNTQETSLTLRTNKLIAAKMSGEATSGLCQPITILCKFTKPSNRFLTQLEKSGIKALDKDGNVITKKLIFPNTRPTSYKFINKAGTEVVVDAKSLYSTFLTDSEFRAAFHTASKTRFISLTDKIFDSIKLRFGFSTTNKLAGSIDEPSLASKLDDVVEVDDSITRAAAAEGGDATDNAIETVVKNEISDSADKITKSGKGDVVGLVAGAACLAGDVPGLLVKANRNFQIMQLIKYSAAFLAIFGAIKAGDAIPGESSAVGDILTKTVNGKSAMDSNGIQYLINGQMNTSNTSYKKFIPGGSMLAALGSTIAITSSSVKTTACSVATNPATGAAINVGLAVNAGETLGTSLLIAIGNVGLGILISQAISAVLPTVLDVVIKNIDTEKVLGFFFGDLTKGLVGESVGDSLVAGILHLLSQTANLGGNMALTVMQAISYEQATKEVQLAYAEEDRATLSPLDTSSPNTMLGSFVQKLVPYYTSSNSISGSITSTLNSIGKIVMGSFGMALQPLTASAETTNASQYQLCDDPTIKDNDIAAGPFCNLIYGVPTQYLDKDPVQVVNELIADGDIDPETGEPIPDGNFPEFPESGDINSWVTPKQSLSAWMTMCTDGKIDEAKNCQITDETTANYALYTIDHRIQKSMDEE